MGVRRHRHGKRVGVARVKGIKVILGLKVIELAGENLARPV